MHAYTNHKYSRPYTHVRKLYLYTREHTTSAYQHTNKYTREYHKQPIPGCRNRAPGLVQVPGNRDVPVIHKKGGPDLGHLKELISESEHQTREAAATDDTQACGGSVGPPGCLFLVDSNEVTDYDLSSGSFPGAKFESLYVCLYVYICVCLFVDIYIYMCVCVCMYIYACSYMHNYHRFSFFMDISTFSQKNRPMLANTHLSFVYASNTDVCTYIRACYILHVAGTCTYMYT